MTESKAENAVEAGTQGNVNPPPDLPWWIIIAESTGGSDLHDCLIVEVSQGPPAEYKFTDREGNTLASSNIFPPVFEDFEYMHQKWTVKVSTNLLEDPRFVFGQWALPDNPTAAKDGQWTAQAGGEPIGAKAAAADAS